MPDGNFSFDFDEHFGSLMHACEGQCRFRGGTQTEIREWQDAFRDRLRSHLGLEHLEKDLAGFVPTAQLVASEDLGAYTRESWRILTEPTVPLPFYLLRPKALAGPPPLVLTPHGHGHPHIYVGLFDSPKEEAEIPRG